MCCHTRGSIVPIESTTIVSESGEITERFGSRVAAVLSGGTVLGLFGDLGTGKTTFTRGLARGLGIMEPVTSPTFTVVQEYRCADGRWLFHLDMYRIPGPDEALAFGVEEYLFAPDAITAVEWPERIEELLQPSDIAGSGDASAFHELRFEHAGQDRRLIRVSNVLLRDAGEMSC